MFYTVFTAFLFSVLFSGTLIYSPRDGLEGAALNQTPLAWSMSNLGQIGYLIIGCAVVLCAHRTRTDLTKPLKYLIRIFSFFFVWQMISKTTGLYYPDEILYSNPVYAFGADQTLGDGIPRINSTFNEPSNAGMFLSAFLAVYLFQRRWLPLLICVLGLLITTSSIGYAMIAGVFGFYSLRSSLSALRRGRINIFLLAQLIGLAVIALVLTTYADELLRLVIFEKSDSGSFITRIGADLRALEIFTETYGLGVGLGSNRPSSFLTYMLSNLGFFGVLFFLRMIYKMIKLDQNVKNTGAQLVVTYIFAKILGGPDLADPVLWSFIAVLASSTKSIPVKTDIEANRTDQTQTIAAQPA